MSEGGELHSPKESDESWRRCGTGLGSCEDASADMRTSKERIKKNRDIEVDTVLFSFNYNSATEQLFAGSLT
jgi:hypothetical protein